LKNDTLRNALIEYYQELERIEKVIQNNNTLHTDQAYGQRIIDLVYVGWKNIDHMNEISAELLGDPEREMKFINLIFMRTGIAYTHRSSLKELKQRTKEMLNQLQNSRS
jgi:hypothetical protein